MKFNKILLVLIIILLLNLTAVFLLLNLDKDVMGVDYRLSKLERYKLYDHEINYSHVVNGVFHPDEDFFCVWKASRSIKEVNRSKVHEYCHVLIKYDEKKHFCKDKIINESSLKNVLY